MLNLSTNKQGFTLLELVSILVILGILAAIAVPRYYSYKEDAELAMIKGTLGNVRTAIYNFRLNTALREGEPRCPTLTELTTRGEVLEEPIPENPYKGNNAVIGGTPRTATGSQGWFYSEGNCEFWINADGLRDL